MLRIVGFMSAAIVFAFLIMVVSYTFLDSPKEKLLKSEIRTLSLQYDMLNGDLNEIHHNLAELRERDDNIYRVIFEAEPMSDAIRDAGEGGVDKYNDFKSYETGVLMTAVLQKADKLRAQLLIQSKSYDELYQMAVNKEEMFASIPAVQPISNKDLRRMASGFGYRIDPIYKTVKFHEGIDFTAPRGTPIYATGDGKVTSAKFNRGGYGNTVVIDHGYGYKTQYAHMNKFAIFKGQKVKRGQVIGYVGSSGKSTAPHLHYEVLKNNVKVDPVNFFYNDLTPEQYKTIVEMASATNQSFD